MISKGKIKKITYLAISGIHIGVNKTPKEGYATLYIDSNKRKFNFANLLNML
jgi:hypothetical protein